jgi:Carboxypeptidase regulatory-like domain
MRQAAISLIALFAMTTYASSQDIRTATLVGTVTDASGSVVPNVAVSATNVDTQVVTHGVTNEDGAYYLPFLNVGNYRLTLEAPGFKKYERSGLLLNAGENPRVDVKLEVGAVGETVAVTASAPLLATDSAVVGSITDAKEIHDTPIPQSKPQHFMYYQEGAQANNDGTYHILGQPETQMSYTLDGISSKQALGKVLGDTNTLITPPVDTLQEAQVLTTGIPAEIGHSAAGAYSLTTKSGTNEVHFSAEERYINKDWLHRQIFNQGPTDTPFEYHNFNATLSGPLVIPKIYNGKNKTFFLLGYRLDYDHETNYATVSVPTVAELGGNFSFNGLGQPIYDPKTIACGAASCANGTGYVATPFPGNVIPQARFDPVAAKFLSLNPYNTPNLTPTFTTTGPTNDYLSGNIYLSDRQAYLAKLDQNISDRQKVFIRYIWNKYRVIGSRNNVLFAWRAIDNTALGFGLPEPIDERNVAAGYIFTVNPTLINELQIGYQRRNDSVYPATANQGWAETLGIPGVGPQTFPGLIASGSSSFTWTANPGGGSRTINEDVVLADNVTKIFGLHTFKFGYQGIRQRENDITASQPSGTYTFPSTLSGAPLVPNTGNSFATLELGAVSAATFTELLSNYLPRWYMNQFYAQDDWRVHRNLTLSIGLRYSLETPANTQYGLKSTFSPTAIDPVSGLMGGIIHPKGSLYSTNYHNFTPRLGLAYNFRPKFVFRGSFGMFTQDLLPEVAQDEYSAQTVVQQPSGNPYPAFYLSQGPGPIAYNITPQGTAEFVGTNYSSRNTSFFDSHLKNPYSMTWSGGFQYEFHQNYLAELTYQGSAAVHLVGTANINTLPWSIYSSTNTTLLNAVYANSQAYLPYTQFGSITETTNPGHSTYHEMIARMEHRFSTGFSANFMFTWSKNLGGTAGSGYQYYDWQLTKALVGSDQKLQFVNQLNYNLPFGKGRHFVNHGGVLDYIVGGWTFLMIQNVRSGLPVTFSSGGSPYKYLSGEGGLNIVPDQTINVPNYSIGPNVFPQSAQNPFYNINAFSYPAQFTEGNAGGGIARTGWVWWPQYSITKTWTVADKYKLTVRMDADNLFPEFAWLNTANNTVNITSPQNFGKFPATTGYTFSNWYGANGTLQGVLRIAF